MTGIAEVLPTLAAGLLAGLGVALPLGAVRVLLLQEGVLQDAAQHCSLPPVPPVPPHGARVSTSGAGYCVILGLAVTLAAPPDDQLRGLMVCPQVARSPRTFGWCR